MDPLIETMDQKSIANKKLTTSGQNPNEPQQRSKLMHKTNQEPISPIILSPSSVLDECSPLKNNRIPEQNHCQATSNHRQCDEPRNPKQTATDDGDAYYDDNKDVIVVREYESSNNQFDSNKFGQKSNNINEKMGNLLIQGEIKSNNPNQINQCDNKEPSASEANQQQQQQQQESQAEGLLRKSNVIGTGSTEDADADVDEDYDEELPSRRTPLAANLLRSHTLDEERPSSPSHRHSPRGSLDITSSAGLAVDISDGIRNSANHPRQQTLAKGHLPSVQSLESRPIYPNVPYSPYASPYGSPRSHRRKTPLRESRRISIEQSGSFLQLNQYKLMDQIGQGSYGLVKLAYSEEDSTHYAMKILSKRRLLRKAGLMSRGPKKTTTSPLDRVYREIAVLKKLDHPNVVKLVEVLDDPLEDSLYLVFELVKQGEVLEIPTDKPLTEERAWSVFRDAVQGLEYLHYQRIIHADIKPGNLLLTECGHVKIADLGVCNEFFGEDATLNNGSTAGTPAFRAPETLFPGQHLYSGKAADIWALGATLYSLLYGNVPFVASSVPFLYEKIKNEILVIPDKPKVSCELVDLIEKMLTKDPGKRITLPQIKEHPWVTANGTNTLPTEDENCRLVQISEEDINSVVKSIPKLDTLILIKTMLKNHSFLNPFNRGISGRAPQRGGSRLERFTRAGRSNSAPGAYHLPIDRQLSGDNFLPALSEHIVSSNSDLAEDC
ncbi:calcium/calmodulin-dependent protein kinase kinase 1 isoform X3 [Eupeodes corollae]|uniref:calcium/calmodulin-dependent protein kinase kinase 1 isoform X3 n=1 Tax=Eupeodes corollae TaxID=290404 RepID=UPI00249257FA|nr:calcium/calmodulin-dependent protein kinase kinase 1 isoform X3 [Eupeodes corollae]